ncbi:MAG: hypothetical protein H6742_15115 [Alphaproteobacteria bacterium]|nr:hypothetical protein [Alphaproteobacteria bacterium]
MPARVRVCAECGHPNNMIGYVTVLAGALLLPATAVAIAEYLEDEEREAERSLQDRRLLTTAYQDLGAAISDFRAASVRIDGACLSTTPYRCHDELRAGVNDLDRAIDAIGPRLAPFNEYSLRKRDEDVLTETWLRCFVAPYYGTATGDGGRFADLQAVFAGPLCSGGACRPEAAVELSAIAYEIWSGPCEGGVPELSRPLTWFHREAQHIFFDRAPDDLLPPGGELTAVRRIVAASDPAADEPAADDPAADDSTQDATAETRTVAAWAAFNDRDFHRAIAAADRCIATHGAIADRMQASLAQTREPPVGAVDAATKRAIFRHGELNDVATCQWIRGQALRALGSSVDAEQAFDEAVRLRHGRTWDPRGWFWAPGAAVEDSRAEPLK